MAATFQDEIIYKRVKGLESSELFILPKWTVLTRPIGGDLVTSLFGYNTAIQSIEWWDGLSWVQPSSNIYTDENAQDAIGNILTSTPSLSFIYNDTANTIVGNVNQSWVRGLFSGSGNISYNAATGIFSSTLSQYTDEMAQDAVGGILSSEFTYDDAANAISINLIDAAKITGTKTSAFISDFNTAADARITLQKGAINGIAPLGADQKVPSIYLPGVLINNVFVVGSQAAMLALAAIQGDIAIRTDINTSYALSTSSPTTLADWKQILSPASVLSVNGLTGTVTLTTTQVAEGTNLYWTGARFDTAFALKTTNNLTEGSTNLYFTNERVDDRVAALIQNGTGLTWTYNDASNILTGNVSLAPFTTTNLIEGTNLYYTDARVQTYGDAHYILNQNSSNQTGNFQITGQGTAGSFKSDFIFGSSGQSAIRLGRAGDSYLNVYFQNNFNRNIALVVVGNTAYFQALGESGSYWNNIIYGGYNDTGAQPHIDFGFGSTGQHRFANTGNVLINTFTDNASDRLQVNGTIMSSSLATSGSAPTTTGTTKMLVSDQNGRISFIDVPSSSVGSLDQVTTVGNVTTNNITVNNVISNGFLKSAELQLVGTGITTLHALSTVPRSIDFPDASGTVALQSWVNGLGFITYAREIDTQYSLTGGGNLATDRMLNLVGDVATPGANKYYSTNGSGARGWNSLPAGNPGTVTTFNFTNANGFVGTVTSATSTPTLSLSTNLTLGSVPFVGASGSLIEDNAKFNWNNTTKRLSVVGDIFSSNSANSPGSGLGSGTFYNTINWNSLIGQPAGSVYSGLYGLLNYNLNATNTFSVSSIHSTNTNILRLGSSANATATVEQSSGSSKRAISANAVMLQFATIGNTVSTSIDHVAGVQIFAPQAQDGSGITSLVHVDNYYALLIGDSAEYSNSYARISNKFGVYQSGSSDLNVFTGKILAGAYNSSTPALSQIDINGSNGYSQLRLRNSYTPTSSADGFGNIGDVAWDASYFYMKTGSGWKRTALTTW